MEQSEIVKELLKWQDGPVRVHVFSYGVGVNHRGYMYLALKSKSLPSSAEVEVGEILPDVICLYHRKQEILRYEPPSELPFVTVDLEDFTSFEIIEDGANQLVIMKKDGPPIEVLIERIERCPS